MVIHAQIVPDLDGPEPRRRVPRVGATVEMSMRKLGSTAVDARLINISSHGFMAETQAVIEPGARVWLCLPGVPRVNALVLWARGSKLGGEFAAPIDPLVVLHAIGRAAGGQP